MPWYDISLHCSNGSVRAEARLEVPAKDKALNGMSFLTSISTSSVDHSIYGTSKSLWYLRHSTKAPLLKMQRPPDKGFVAVTMQTGVE